mmetsp:Transcript_18947/g.60083  ORF Transcript_18947/g.60083 Transcript_18947/m.60083 type:complete len:516 (+) Transcript_18947:598-2145(+)
MCEASAVPLHLMGLELVPGAGDPEHLRGPVLAAPPAGGCASGLLGLGSHGNQGLRRGLRSWSALLLLGQGKVAHPGIAREQHRSVQHAADVVLKLPRLKVALHLQDLAAYLPAVVHSAHGDAVRRQHAEVDLANQLGHHLPVGAGLQLPLVLCVTKLPQKVDDEGPDACYAGFQARVPPPEADARHEDPRDGRLGVPAEEAKVLGHALLARNRPLLAAFLQHALRREEDGALLLGTPDVLQAHLSGRTPEDVAHGGVPAHEDLRAVALSVLADEAAQFQHALQALQPPNRLQGAQRQGDGPSQQRGWHCGVHRVDADEPAPDILPRHPLQPLAHCRAGAAAELEQDQGDLLLLDSLHPGCIPGALLRQPPLDKAGVVAKHLHEGPGDPAASGARREVPDNAVRHPILHEPKSLRGRPGLVAARRSALQVVGSTMQLYQELLWPARGWPLAVHSGAGNEAPQHCASGPSPNNLVARMRQRLPAEATVMLPEGPGQAWVFPEPSGIAEVFIFQAQGP